MEEEHSEEMVFEDNQSARILFGRHDCNLREVERVLGVHIRARGNTLCLSGPAEQVEKARSLLDDYYYLIGRNFEFSNQDFSRALRTAAGADQNIDFKTLGEEVIFLSAKNRKVVPKGHNQRAYVNAIRRHDIVFGIGPAGTGKTYLAVAVGAAMLAARAVDRIILTRPAVEAGEKLGFLPGDLQEKINPYLRPLYDALYDMMTAEKIARLMERAVIEIAPLAFMRGRTLNDSFIILDEAQNTTGEQMKMFLTRLGFNSRAVITGDITQTDLPRGRISGLIEARDLLQGIEGIEFIYFDEKDVVRHPLVAEVIKAYNRREQREEENGGKEG